MITAQTFFDDDRLPGCKLFRARLLAGNGWAGGAGATFASLDGKTDWQLVHGGSAEVGAAGGIDREDGSVPGTVTKRLSLVCLFAFHAPHLRGRQRFLDIDDGLDRALRVED